MGLGIDRVNRGHSDSNSSEKFLLTVRELGSILRSLLHVSLT